MKEVITYQEASALNAVEIQDTDVVKPTALAVSPTMLKANKPKAVKLSATPVAVQAVPVKAVKANQAGTTKQVKGSTSPVQSVSADAATEVVEVSPSVIASGKAYKFRVLVTGRDGSEATAYALLNVLYSPPPPPQEKIRLTIQEGWNLMTLPGEGELNSGTCSALKELYAFVYVKEIEQYMTFKEAADYMGEARLRAYLRTHAFWVYSFDDCYMGFSLEDATSFNDLSLDKGWNFVPITQDMEGNSLSDVGGDCDFEKSYLWDASKQDWKRIGNGMKFSEDQLYNGFISKVDDSCDFGWGAIISPPPLPE